MHDLGSLYRTYCERRAAQSGDTSRLLDLALIYDGGLITRIAELDETAESSVPNLVSQGIDAYARYAASNQPGVTCPPVKPNSAASRARASLREQVIEGWWDGSKMSLLDYQRFRYHFGYGSMPVLIRPSPDAPGVPRWETVNPIGVLPGPKAVPYSPEVPDAFVATSQSAKWVADHYGVTFGSRVRPDTMLEVVTYNDPEQVTVFCVGPAGPEAPTWQSGVPAGSGEYGGTWNERGTRVERIDGPAGQGWLALLSTTPNFAGVCTVSCPGVISLSRVSGFVQGILSKHKLHARLMALTVEAITAGIHPDQWMLTDPTQNGQGVVREADGLRGVRGHIDGGQIVVPQINPSYLTFNLLDRLESYQREEAGIIAEFGGASGTNIRTRARGEAVAAATVDPRVLEAHQIAAVAREHEITLAVAVSKGYGGSRKFGLYVGRGKQTTRAEYVPTEVFENDQAKVAYSLAGTDRQGQIIALAQSQGTKELSVATARRKNPLVDDANFEETQIRAEALEEVAMASLAQIASASPLDMALILRRVREGKMLEDVIEEVDRVARERQASSGAPGEPTGPVEPGAPEAQPGLGLPGGGGQAPETVPEPTPSIRNLASLFVQSRQPSRQSAVERAAG